MISWNKNVCRCWDFWEVRNISWTIFLEHLLGEKGEHFQSFPSPPPHPCLLHWNSSGQWDWSALPSLKSGFAPAFSAEWQSLGSIFLSLSYISISRQFTEETRFEFWLHLVTLNWTKRPVIIKGRCLLLTVPWKWSRATQYLNFIFPWNWSHTPCSVLTFSCLFFFFFLPSLQFERYRHIREISLRTIT